MSILVTGGTGYIGSHTTVELLNKGYDVVLLDNLSNSDEAVVHNIEQITGKSVRLYSADLLDSAAVEEVFKSNDIQAVMHFAGFKAVGESVANPLKYYSNNLMSTLNLCDIMAKYDVYNLIFSSSATVYGFPDHLPITEEAPTAAVNPYGQTKLMGETILKDLCSSNENWKVASLRYFNPVGAHPTALIGENPNGVPANLMPYITQVASGERDQLHVFGADYPTKDGTGVRDFIHVVDLAKGHIAALENINTINGFDAYNLGTGQGYSVLEVINAFEQASGVSIPYEIKERRPGDAPTSYADPQKANTLLNWQAEKELFDMCRDAWNWEQQKTLSYSTS